jgi:hypothetical protein
VTAAALIAPPSGTGMRWTVAPPPDPGLKVTDGTGAPSLMNHS